MELSDLEKSLRDHIVELSLLIDRLRSSGDKTKHEQEKKVSYMVVSSTSGETIDYIFDYLDAAEIFMSREIKKKKVYKVEIYKIGDE